MKSFIASVTLALLSIVGFAAADLAVDASGAQSTSAWSCARGQGFNRAIARIYQEACGSGGSVDSGGLTNYRNARSAGYTYIDLYMFPCTGSAYNCKSPSQQVNELVNYVNQNSLLVQTIWLDLEKDTTSCSSSWNYGATGNLNLAKQFVSAFKASGFKFGIYSSSGEWSTLFGSTSAVLDNSVPLWYAHYDGNANFNDFSSQRFGGWSSPTGKQYGVGSGHCGSYDLNYFV